MGGGRRDVLAYIGIKASSFPQRGSATHPAGPLSVYPSALTEPWCSVSG